MKPRQKDETDASYIARLEAQNAGLKKNSKAVSDWAERVSDAVTLLTTEGSVVFQAMAERAHVREHPSVTEAVRLFDFIAHPQWSKRDAKPPKPEWPTDWDFDAPTAWSGDADMVLNSPVAQAIEILENMRFSVKEPQWRTIDAVVGSLQEALRNRVGAIKDTAGFQPRQVTIRNSTHFRDMSADELRDLVSALGYMALDLAQDMEFANQMLRRDLRASTYRRVAGDLHRLAYFDVNQEPGHFDIKIVGGVQEVA